MADDPFAKYTSVEKLSLSANGCHCEGKTPNNLAATNNFKLNEYLDSNKQIEVGKELIVHGEFSEKAGAIFSKIANNVPTIIFESLSDDVVEVLQSMVFPATTTVKIQRYIGNLLKTFELKDTFPTLKTLYMINTNFEHINPEWNVEQIHIHAPNQADKYERAAINNFLTNNSNTFLEFISCKQETLDLCADAIKPTESYVVSMDLSTTQYYNKAQGADGKTNPIP